MNTMLTKSVVGLACAILPSLALAADTGNQVRVEAPRASVAPPAVNNVCGFRGDGSGVFSKTRPPTLWGSEGNKNILWKTEVGRSQSSPVIGGNRVFVSAETDLLLCLDRATGKVAWKKDNGFESLPAEMKAVEKRPPSDSGCGYSAATPITDGQRVWASFGTGIVVCYDLDGKRQWVRYFDQTQVTQYGRSVSPLMAGGKLLVTVGFLMALDPATGKTIWECPEAVPSYGTPVAVRIAGVEVIITPKGDVIRVADGKVLGAGLAETPYSSPVVAQGVLYFGMPVQALRLPDKAEATSRLATIWEASDPGGDSFASPVVYDGIFYMVGNDGVLWAFEAATGKMWYRQELVNPGGGSGGPAGNFYPSLVVAGGNLLVANDAGQTIVVATGRVFKEVARNTLEEGSGASPVAVGAELFVRGGNLLYCLTSK